MKTSYKGCNKKIKKALKKGKHIRCDVWDTEECDFTSADREIVIAYIAHLTYSYRTAGSHYRYAKPNNF